jgi:hypothetical protein
MIFIGCLHYKHTDNNLIEDKGLNIFCICNFAPFVQRKFHLPL